MRNRMQKKISLTVCANSRGTKIFEIFFCYSTNTFHSAKGIITKGQKPNNALACIVCMEINTNNR